MNKKDTVVLIGRSDFLDTKACMNFEYCTEIYDCGTINWASTRYYGKYCFFLDHYVWRMCHDKILGKPKFITSSMNLGYVKDYPHEIFEQHRMYTKPDIYTDKTLLSAGFTHDFAISYLIKCGYKNIVLAGCADFETKTYAKQMNVKEDINWKYSEKVKINSLYLINNIFSKHVNIYTLNPNSVLNVKRITVKQLLELGIRD